MVTEFSFCGSGRGNLDEKEFSVESGFVVVGRPATGKPAALQVAGVDLAKGRIFVSEDLVSPVDFASTEPSELLSRLKGQDVCAVESPFPRTESGYPFAVSLIAGRFVNAVRLPEAVIWNMFMMVPPPPPQETEWDISVDASFTGRISLITFERIYTATIEISGDFKQSGQSDPAADVLKAIRALITGEPCPQTPNLEVEITIKAKVRCIARKAGDDGIREGWEFDLDFNLKGSVSVGGRFCGLANAATGK